MGGSLLRPTINVSTTQSTMRSLDRSTHSDFLSIALSFYRDAQP